MSPRFTSAIVGKPSSPAASIRSGIDPHPGGTQPLEERRLQLDGGDVGLHGLQDAPAELQGGFGLGQSAQFFRKA